MATSVSANRKRASQHLAIGVYILNKQNITCPLVDKNFIFSFSTRYLTCSLRSLVRYRVEHSKIKFVSTCGHVISSILEMNEWPRLHFYTIATLETRRKLGRVNFCKDFWDCYYIGMGEKSANSADRCVISNNPRNSCGTHVGSRSILFSKKANDIDCFTISEISRQLNKTVNPCEDFFSYVCGGFFKKHQLGENNSVESAFSVLFHDNMRVIRHVLRNATSIYPQVWNQVCFS